jgi:hypothetical protein
VFMKAPTSSDVEANDMAKSYKMKAKKQSLAMLNQMSIYLVRRQALKVAKILPQPAAALKVRCCRRISAILVAFSCHQIITPFDQSKPQIRIPLETT